MFKLLQIDSTPSHGKSVSLELTTEFVTHSKAGHPGAELIERDLTATNLNYGQDRGAFLAPHLQAVQAHAQRRQGGQA